MDYGKKMDAMKYMKKFLFLKIKQYRNIIDVLGTHDMSCPK
jgi:hypothetical protein